MVGTGTVLKNRWKLSKKIGQGAFGEIYNGTDTSTLDPIAVKLERWDNKKAVLKMEVAVLKKLQHCQHACRYVSAAAPCAAAMFMPGYSGDGAVAWKGAGLR